MSYGQLWDQIQTLMGNLQAIGIRPEDRIAVALPNGPEMATSFLAISATAVFAPLNPNYRTSEFEFYLSDLCPKALIIQAGSGSIAAAVAQSLGIRIIELSPLGDKEAGLFALDGIPQTQSAFRGTRAAEETSLILHTSGTTARPKMVALSQGNLCSSAQNISCSLGLSPKDLCLNIMPLFHIHGLLGAVLSSIAAGSSIVCTPGFHTLRFFDWFEEFQPTWYTAVPTMHQAILNRAHQNPVASSRSRLRFIRSCSSPLPPKLMDELEREFRVPVVEAYGMTEATHQVASNPLPPGIRKRGSVGLPTGSDVAVLGADGSVLPPGKVGAVVIRGSSVAQRYENNPEATKSSFIEGWFNTGDQGKLDSQGYLFLTGRTKEIINRGGEKISPREIDEVLLDHPAVTQALAFGIPDEKFGEELGAAVVLRNSVCDANIETELRDFVSRRLAAFKVPRHIVIVEEIPKGATGKPQRFGMAVKLGLTESARTAPVGSYVPPQSELELQIVRIWEELLKIRPIGIRHNFLELGGDSLLAAEMMTQLEETCGIRLPETGLLSSGTIEQLAAAVLRTQREEIRSPIVAIQPKGSQVPFFFLHGQWRGGGLYCRDLARILGKDQPFYAVMPSGLDGKPVARTIETMARERVQSLLEIQPDGPIRLGGYCNGALVAFEMARQLERLGRKVDLLAVVETHAPNIPFRKIWTLVKLASKLFSLNDDRQAKWFFRLRKIQNLFRAPARSGMCDVLRSLFRSCSTSLTKLGITSHDSRTIVTNSVERNARAYADPYEAINRYVPGTYNGRIALIRTEDIGSTTANFSSPNDPSAGWADVAPQVQVHTLVGTHESIVREHVDRMAEALAQCLEDAEAASANSRFVRETESSPWAALYFVPKTFSRILERCGATR
jgi:acyl-CoA synthetase (AMP-forming)/AMP-acid ligase II/thioesterase domain-containing protein/acyl carrier protein